MTGSITLVSPTNRVVVLREEDGWQGADIDALLENGWRLAVLHPLYADVIDAAQAVVHVANLDPGRNATAMARLRRTLDALDREGP